MTVEKPKPKQLLRPITIPSNCNSLKAREKSRVHGAIDFGFASHWLKNWRESFKPITKRSNRNHVISFDSHLKTALKKGGLPFDLTGLSIKIKHPSNLVHFWTVWVLHR